MSFQKNEVLTLSVNETNTLSDNAKKFENISMERKYCIKFTITWYILNCNETYYKLI